MKLLKQILENEKGWRRADEMGDYSGRVGSLDDISFHEIVEKLGPPRVEPDYKTGKIAASWTIQSTTNPKLVVQVHDMKQSKWYNSDDVLDVNDLHPDGVEPEVEAEDMAIRLGLEDVRDWSVAGSPFSKEAQEAELDLLRLALGDKANAVVHSHHDRSFRDLFVGRRLKN